MLFAGSAVVFEIECNVEAGKARRSGEMLQRVARAEVAISATEVEMPVNLVPRIHISFHTNVPAVRRICAPECGTGEIVE